MSWTSAYATTRDLYGVTRIVNGKRTNPHRGCDFAIKAGDVVPAYEECIVVESGTEVTKGYTAVLGWYVVAQSVRDGRFLGWAHLRRGTRPKIGTRLRPGDQVGIAASGPVPRDAKGNPIALSPTQADINYPGTAWSGPHIHTTVSDTKIGIYSGNTFDPLPRIRQALAALASTNITPINTTPIIQGGGFAMYTEQNTNQDKINLASDVLNKPVVKNIDGYMVSEATILNALERNQRIIIAQNNQTALGVKNTEDKVNAVVAGVGALGQDDGADAETIAAAIKSALPAQLAQQVVAELGRQLG